MKGCFYCCFLTNPELSEQSNILQNTLENNNVPYSAKSNNLLFYLKSDAEKIQNHQNMSNDVFDN